jgi:hypothetical protein
MAPNHSLMLYASPSTREGCRKNRVPLSFSQMLGGQRASVRDHLSIRNSPADRDDRGGRCVSLERGYCRKNGVHIALESDGREQMRGRESDDRVDEACNFQSHREACDDAAH